MITNVSKTEVAVFMKDPISISLNVNGSILQTEKTMKVLGVTFKHDLNWSTHVNQTIRKASGLLGRLRFMKRNLTTHQILKVTTAYFYPTVYYGAEAWLSSATLTSNEWRLLNTSHYKALRIAVGDLKRKWSRKKLTETCKRATPREWAHYSLANVVYSILLNKEPLHLYNGILSEMTLNERKPLRPRFYDSSRTKVGKQALKNRIADTASRIQEDWYSNNITKDQLRTIFKRAFFSYFDKNKL